PAGGRNHPPAERRAPDPAAIHPRYQGGQRPAHARRAATLCLRVLNAWRRKRSPHIMMSLFSKAAGAYTGLALAGILGLTGAVHAQDEADHKKLVTSSAQVMNKPLETLT